MFRFPAFLTHPSGLSGRDATWADVLHAEHQRYKVRSALHQLNGYRLAIVDLIALSSVAQIIPVSGAQYANRLDTVIQIVEVHPHQ